MLAEFPRYLKIVAIMADIAACRIKNPGAAGNAGLKKSARPINAARAILFQGLVRLHFDAFGCWPKVTRDTTSERNGPAVQWVRAVIDHATTYLRSHGVDPVDAQAIAQRNKGGDALGKALEEATDIVRGERDVSASA